MEGRENSRGDDLGGHGGFGDVDETFSSELGDGSRHLLVHELAGFLAGETGGREGGGGKEGNDQLLALLFPTNKIFQQQHNQPI